MRLSFILALLLLSTNASAVVNFSARWNRPQPIQNVIQDLTGARNFQTEGRTIVEVGPYSDPICSDCLYLDAFPHLVKPEEKARLILSDARQMPFADKSVDMMIFKNFPWLLATSVQAFGYERVRGLGNPVEFNEWLSQSHLHKQIIFQELHRVLKNDGAFFVLFSLAGESTGDVLKHLSHFVVEGEKLGFQVEELRNIKDLSSEYLREKANKYRAPIPLSGLMFRRVNSFVPDSLNCENQLTK